jgi:hypothetical protein
MRQLSVALFYPLLVLGTVDGVWASGLSLKAVANGKLQDVAVLVTDAETGKNVGEGRTRSDPSTNPCVIALPAGVYDVEVKAVGLEGDIDREFRGLTRGASHHWDVACTAIEGTRARFGTCRKRAEDEHLPLLGRAAK